jgi:protein TonB
LPVAKARVGRLGRPPEFGKKRHNPVRRFGAIAVVIVLHVVLVYALLNGLATKVLQVIQHPIETRIIEAVKPPPPPLPTVQLPPPKFAPPPPPFVPPPEVQVQAPPPPQSIMKQVAPVQSAPAVAPPVQAPPAPPAPVSLAVGVACPNSDQVRSQVKYPRVAQENNITGDVLIEFVVDAQGHITNERVVQSADPDLDRAALNAVRRFNCISQGQAVRVQVPFSFNLN